MNESDTSLNQDFDEHKAQAETREEQFTENANDIGISTTPPEEKATVVEQEQPTLTYEMNTPFGEEVRRQHKEQKVANEWMEHHVPDPPATPEKTMQQQFNEAGLQWDPSGDKKWDPTQDLEQDRDDPDIER